MSLDTIVNITITNSSPSVSQAGFGTPLIVGHSAGFAELVRTYTSLTGVADDFATTTLEYKKAAAMFAQNPNPPTIKIGRRSVSTATWIKTLSFKSSPNLTTGYVYTVAVNGTNYTYTVQASDTLDDVIAGLTTALDAISGISATDNTPTTDTITLTADAGGVDYTVKFPLEDGEIRVQDASTLSGGTLADDLGAILAADDDWYALCLTTNGKLDIEDAADWVESNGKFFIAMTQDLEVLDSGDTDDAASEASSSNLTRTKVVWHNDGEEQIDAAWLGRCLPENPGSITWEYKTLAGISAPPLAELSTTQKTTIVTKDASHYESLAGVSFAKNSAMADDSFYLDTRRGIDWIEARIQEAVFATLTTADKVPYTEAGVALIRAQINAVLLQAAARDIIVESTISITTPPVASVSAANKAARTLPDVSFSAQLAGAIHTLTIAGDVYV